MRIETKKKIVFFTNSIFLLLAVWLWWTQSNRSVLSFIGIILLFNIIGITLGIMIVLPFKTEYPEMEDDGYLKKLYDYLKQSELGKVKDSDTIVEDKLLIAENNADYGLLRGY